MSEIQQKKQDSQISKIHAIGPCLTAAFASQLDTAIREKCADSTISKMMETYDPITKLAASLRSVNSVNTLVLNTLSFLRTLSDPEVFTYNTLPQFAEVMELVRKNLVRLNNTLINDNPLLQKLLDSSFQSIKELRECITEITSGILEKVGTLPKWAGLGKDDYEKLKPHLNAVKRDFLDYINGFLPPSPKDDDDKSLIRDLSIAQDSATNPSK